MGPQPSLTSVALSRGFCYPTAMPHAQDPARGLEGFKIITCWYVHIAVWKGHVRKKGVSSDSAIGGGQETWAWGWRRGILFPAHLLVTFQTTQHGWGGESVVEALAT